jgi:MOSC domain-containing protein YiiM
VGLKLELLSVNVGQPAVIGRRQGRDVRSAIGKAPVRGAEVVVTARGIDGDRQAATAVHGLPDMAVYVYPSEHWPTWATAVGRDVGPGVVGENLSISGLLEDDARLGDVWAWGDAVLRVTKPRTPCYKLDLHLGIDAETVMYGFGGCGWYLEVLTPGVAPTSGAIDVVERGAGPSISAMFTP